MSKLDRITQNTYDHIASEFARVNASALPQLTLALQRFVDLIGTDARVLDLGCGAGRDAAYLQSRNVRVIGADFSMGMLAEASAIGVKHLVQMNMLYLGFPAEYFQGVWCNAALLHLPKTMVPAALAEIHRVLVSPGILFLALKVGTTEGYEPNPYATPSLKRFFAFYSEAEIKALLSANGFRMREITEDRTGENHWLHLYAAKTQFPR